MPQSSDLSDNTLIIKANDGTALLTLSKITTNKKNEIDWEKLSKNHILWQKLSQLIQYCPNIVSSIHVGTSNYMNVLIAPGKKLAESQQHGGLIGVLIDKITGKLSGGAKLESGALSDLVTGGAILNIASAVLGQMHLANINKELAYIKTEICSIAEFQKNERLSILSGSIHYFEQISQSVISGDLSFEIIIAIENQEAELLRVQEHLMRDIINEKNTLERLEDKEWIGQNDYINALSQKLERIETLSEEFLLCLRARSCGLQLLQAFPDRDIRKENRKNDIKKSLNSLMKELKYLIEIYNKKAKNINFFNVIHVLRLLKCPHEEMLCSNSVFNMKLKGIILFEKFEKIAKLLQEEFDELSQKIFTYHNPISIDLKIENGILVATRVHDIGTSITITERA